MIGRPTVSILQPGLGATGLHQSKVTGPSTKANRMLEPSERRATNQSAGTEARERLANRRASGEEGGGGASAQDAVRRATALQEPERSLGPGGSW